MEIFVNGEPVSFSLEKEKSLSDIFTALSAWAAAESARITKLAVNGAELDISLSAKWGSMPLDSVETLEVSTGGAAEKTPHGLAVIRDYFEGLLAALKADNEKAVREFLQEYPYIREALETHLRDIFASAEDCLTGREKSFGCGALLSDSTAPLGPAEKAALVQYAQALNVIAQDRLHEIEDPRKEAAAVARLLTAVRPSLENVPVMLQSGKDREAMQNILAYTELALKAIRILAQREGGAEDSRIFCKEFNGILGELTNAFEVRDSVLIGDLLEYEIAPRTDRLAELLEGGSR
jgi:hypothetical protein